MPKRSLTLLETLIAIVLILAMSALVVPSLLSSMEERTFEAAADVTNDHLMMARAHAQATGSPVEVTYRADRSQVLARLFHAGLSDERLTLAAKPGPQADRVRNLGPLAPEFDQFTKDQSAIEEPWAVRDISPGVRIVNHHPQSSDQDEAVDEPNLSANETADADTPETFGLGQEVRLAVFMPDGSALLGEPVWLNDDKGRVGMLTINPWSGIPIFQRLTESGESTSSQDVKAKDTRQSRRDDDERSEKSERSHGKDAPTKYSLPSDENGDTLAPRSPREGDFDEE